MDNSLSAWQTLHYRYNPVGHMTHLIDGNRVATRWEYDAHQRVQKKIYADGRSIQYTYDLANNIKTANEAGSTKTYTYDACNNPTNVATTGLGAVQFRYDALNRCDQMIDSIGTTEYIYDDASQLTEVNGPWADDTITYGYDELGRQTSYAVNSAGEARTFDDLGRMAEFTNPLGTFAVTYAGSASSRPTSIAFPNGQQTSIGYSSSPSDIYVNQIEHATSGSANLSKFEYERNANALITRLKETLGSAPMHDHHFGYNRIEQLANIVTKDTGGTVLESAAFQYDAGGNRRFEQNGSLVAEELSNNLNQLTSKAFGRGRLPIRGETNEPSSVTTNGAVARTWDDNTFEGEVNVHEGVNAITVAAVDANSNFTSKNYEVLVSGSGTRYCHYDGIGNLVDDGQQRYEWDKAGCLKAITYAGSSLRTEFTYDGLNRRVKEVEKDGTSVTSEKRFIWSGTTLVEERDGANVVIRRFYEHGMLIGSDKFFFTRDHLRSVREVVDETEALRARYTYDAWGRRTKLSGDVDSPFGFTRHYYHDASKLHLAPFRAYNADFGRWISRDPLQEAGGVNLYGYALGNPVNWTDPLGLATLFDPCDPHYDGSGGGDPIYNDPVFIKMVNEIWKNSVPVSIGGISVGATSHEYYSFVRRDSAGGLVSAPPIKADSRYGGYTGGTFLLIPPGRWPEFTAIGPIIRPRVPQKIVPLPIRAGDRNS